MRVSDHIVNKRRQDLAKLIRQNRYMPISDICGHFGISEATARRDLRALEEGSEILRTFGGAIGDFNEDFESFNERRKFAAEAKRGIARRAVQQIQPGMICFFDAGSTLFAIAEELSISGKDDVRVVTNNLAIAEILSPVKGISVTLTGGKLESRQEVLLGEVAEHMLGRCTFDIAFMSALSADELGIWNNQNDVVYLQQIVIEKSVRPIFCMDKSKIGNENNRLVARWREVHALLTDADKIFLEQKKINLPTSKHWKIGN